MEFKEFKNMIREKFYGKSIIFARNEIQYVAYVDNAFTFMSNPYSTEIHGFMNGKSIGLLSY